MRTWLADLLLQGMDLTQNPNCYTGMSIDVFAPWPHFPRAVACQWWGRVGVLHPGISRTPELADPGTRTSWWLCWSFLHLACFYPDLSPAVFTQSGSHHDLTAKLAFSRSIYSTFHPGTFPKKILATVYTILGSASERTMTDTRMDIWILSAGIKQKRLGLSPRYKLVPWKIFKIIISMEARKHNIETQLD